LVVVLPGLADDGSSGFESIVNHANAALAMMVEDCAITADERARMVLGSYPRRKNELLAPFAQSEAFHDLTVEHFDMSVVADAAWTQFERDRDSEALATKQARFFRSVFMPSLASALDRVRAGETEALAAFGDHLEECLKRRLASEPAPTHSLVQTVVLAKQA
jgi:hypothetical protein